LLARNETAVMARTHTATPKLPIGSGSRSQPWPSANIEWQT